MHWWRKDTWIEIVSADAILMTACQSSGRRSQRVATRGQLRSQLFVRSTCQRCRPCGSAPLSRWRLPRQTLRVAVPGGIGSPLRRGRLIRGAIPRCLSCASSSAEA
jgi:hypothetical protein